LKKNSLKRKWKTWTWLTSQKWKESNSFKNLVNAQERLSQSMQTSTRSSTSLLCFKMNFLKLTVMKKIWTLFILKNNSFFYKDNYC
jgi:hypothetical protein